MHYWATLHIHHNDQNACIKYKIGLAISIYIYFVKTITPVPGLGDSLKNREDVVEFFRQHFTKQFRESNFNFLFRKNEKIGDTSWLMQPDTSVIQKYYRRVY